MGPAPSDPPDFSGNSFRKSRTHRWRERAIAILADRQHRVVATWQLKPLGFIDDDLRYRSKVGRLHRKYRGVYAVGHSKLTPQGHWMAAALAYGPDAVLSHWSAIAAWGLGTSPWKPHVTTPHKQHSRQGIVAHTAALHPEDVTRRDGLPVTSVPRTILDLAAKTHPDRIGRLIEDAVRAGVFDLRALERAIARSPRRAGVPRLQAVLADYRGAPDLRSNHERAFRKLIKDLPEPHYNMLVAGVLCDVHWPQWRLTVEIDSRPFHMTPRAFERDRIRDAILQKAGYRVLRITEKRLYGEPAAVLADVVALSRT